MFRRKTCNLNSFEFRFGSILLLVVKSNPIFIRPGILKISYIIAMLLVPLVISIVIINKFGNFQLLFLEFSFFCTKRYIRIKKLLLWLQMTLYSYRANILFNLMKDRLALFCFRLYWRLAMLNGLPKHLSLWNINWQ